MNLDLISLCGSKLTSQGKQPLIHQEDCDRILLPPLSYTEVVCELKPEKLKHYRSVWNKSRIEGFLVI